MKQESAVLRELRVLSPCKASWGSMRGDASARHCDSCGMLVHHISELSTREAEGLLAGGERVCVRFERGADGNVQTRDNRPKALRAFTQRAVALLGRAAAILGLSVGGMLASGCVMGVPVYRGNPASRPSCEPNNQSDPGNDSRAGEPAGGNHRVADDRAASSARLPRK